MSKIFEALAKAKREVGDLTLPLILEEQSPEPEVDPVAAIEDLAPQHASVTPGAIEEPATEPAPEMPLDPAPTPEAHFVDEPPPGLVPMIRSAPIRLAADAPLLPFGGGHYRAGEQYRIVRTKIVHHPLQPRFLVVSSASSGDGKTVSAINIAATLALKSDVNVLLVDADFRRSSLATMLGLPAQPGLAEVLEGTCQLQDAILRSEQLANLYLLPGGKARSNPAELLDSPDWRRVSAVFRKEFHFVVVDAPPVTGVADYELIQAVCDGVVVVVRPDNSNRKLCFKALETVPKEKFVGVLVNCFPEWFLWKTHEYYSYSSE